VPADACPGAVQLYDRGELDVVRAVVDEHAAMHQRVEQLFARGQGIVGIAEPSTGVDERELHASAL
jgi:hypothetical protein